MSYQVDRIDITFILASFYWPKSLTDGGEKESRVKGEKN